MTIPALDMAAVKARLPTTKGWNRHWWTMGEYVCFWLSLHGLRPDHTFLDVGCGRLKSTLHVLAYLEPGHYFGFDREPSMFEHESYITAPALVRAAELEAKAPTFWLTDSFDCYPLKGRRVDVALAQSVFSHLGPESVGQCLSQLRRVIHPDGVFYATIFPGSGPDVEIGEPHRGRPVPRHDEFTVVRYPPDRLAVLAEQAGWRCRWREDYDHPSGQIMVEFEPLP